MWEVNLLAILVGPVLAVYVGWRLQRHGEWKQRRLDVFYGLVEGRFDPTNIDRMKALAMIAVVFSDNDGIQTKWHAWYDAVANRALENPDGIYQRNIKYYDLLIEMAKTVGLGKITRNDLERSYFPEPLGKLRATRLETELELNRIVKNTENLGTARINPPQIETPTTPPPT